MDNGYFMRIVPPVSRSRYNGLQYALTAHHFAFYLTDMFIQWKKVMSNSHPCGSMNFSSTPEFKSTVKAMSNECMPISQTATSLLNCKHKLRSILFYISLSEDAMHSFSILLSILLSHSHSFYLSTSLTCFGLPPTHPSTWPRTRSHNAVHTLTHLLCKQNVLACSVVVKEHAWDPKGSNNRGDFIFFPHFVSAECVGFLCFSYK